MLIRPRRDGDIAACVELLREVHELDGYPRYLPGDPESFLLQADAYGCWVAEVDGALAGHVSLVRRTSDPAMRIASEALGRPEEELGVIARLFVSAAARRSGAGRRLLGTATAEAVARGLWPVLDVVTDAAAAIALYERAGWTRVGTTTVRFRSGHSLDEHIYLGPAPALGAHPRRRRPPRRATATRACGGHRGVRRPPWVRRPPRG
jgi:GNAT superfamily N-acetyltransferase